MYGVQFIAVVAVSSEICFDEAVCSMHIYLLRNKMYRKHFHLDADECKDGSNRCSADADCENVFGNYTCKCKPGMID